MKKLILLFCFFSFHFGNAQKQVISNSGSRPNIILIYADDLGYGDLSGNGATQIKTPSIDIIAKEGLRFTNAYATSATCTPSRFSLLTGKYAWRKQGTNIAPGDAALIIPTNMLTLPKMLQNAGYKTAAVGKWHLGLGPTGGPDWNGEIAPGPLEVGFNYAFIMPATGDRVPCVYLENYRIVDLDPTDPIYVDYKKKVGNEPTGAENPELLKMKYSNGHDKTIVNGVSRIGWMAGGKKARWIDEEMAGVFTSKALRFMEENKTQPFFLYFATHDIHVPRLPHSRFVGKSNMGPRGDAILELDWTVNEITKKLHELKIADNTILIFSSDNGPVIDDGYADDAVERLGSHTPSGNMRGGKYSAFEAGTRIPFIVRWPHKIKRNTQTNAPFSQIDLFASLASLVGQVLHNDDAPDSHQLLNTLLGKERRGREYVIEQPLNSNLCIRKGVWKYIPPHNGPKKDIPTNTEYGNDTEPQLYNISTDPGEKNNVAPKYPKKVKELAELLQKIKDNDFTRK